MSNERDEQPGQPAQPAGARVPDHRTRQDVPALQEDIAHFEAFEAIALAWMEEREAQQKGDDQ